MKVLVICDGMYPPQNEVSGMKYIYDLQQILAAEKTIDLHILTCIEKFSINDVEKWFKEESLKSNIKFHYFYANPLLRNIRIMPKVLWKLMSLFHILKLQIKYKFDIIHIYSSSLLWLSIFNIYRLFFKGAIVGTFCSYVAGIYGSTKLSWSIKYIDRLIYITKDQGRLLSNLGIQKKIHLPAGIKVKDFNCISKREKYNLINKLKLNIDSEKVILYLGPLEERKGIFILAKAIPEVLKKNKDVVFIIASAILAAGSFSLEKFGVRDYNFNKDKILSFIGNFSKKVKFLVGKQNVPALMSITDIFVLPSITHYGTFGYPITLLEAMAAGKAIVASDIIGVNELIIDGYNGLLYPAKDSSALADTLKRLLKNNELANKLARNAKFSSRNYDLVSIGKKLYELYNDLTK